MPDLNPVSSVINAASKGVETVAGVFTTNKERDAQRSADEQMALMRAYQAEFNQRSNRTVVDAVADAFNRLVRPFIVTLVLSIFIVAYISPAHLAEISLSLKVIPDGYWALLSIIIAFYFGGRMQLKSQQFKFSESQATAVKALIETKKEFRKLEMDTDEPDKLVGDENGKNPLVDEQRKTQVNSIIEAAIDAESSDSPASLESKVKELLSEDAESVKERRRFGPRRRHGFS